MPRATVLLADDHPGNKELLRLLLETAFDVVADVEDGSDLVREAARLSPDVIVTDIAMPGVDGFEAARRILARDPDARIVFVTGHGDAALLDRGMSLGGRGFVTKLTAGEGLVPAVRAVLRGERAVSGMPPMTARTIPFET